jgi:glyoxylase-like metal-dependent hydrolase (beta-lactamase superfamily II)
VAELPKPAEEVVDGIDGVLLTHLHLDHFDLRARELIPRGTPVFHQAPDRKQLEQDGFEQLTAAADSGPFEWLGLEVRRGWRGARVWIYRASCWTRLRLRAAQRGRADPLHRR